MNLGSAGTRVLLVGTGTHAEGSRLPPVPAVGATLTALATAFRDRCGVRPESLPDPVLNPDPIEFGNALTRAAAEAEDVLVLYYVGHGLVSPGNKLHLATRETDDLSTGLAFKALPYSAVEDALTLCRARTIVVVLDCCFAGRAHGSFGTSASDAFELASLGGAYVLASAASDEQALAPEGERHTAFSGALLTLLAEGDPAGLPDLTVEAAYRHLRRVLPSRNVPAPVRHLSGQAGDLVLAPNPAAAVPRAPVPRTDGQPQADQPCPYRGLDPFTADDARFFFGREQLTRELLDDLAAWSAEPGPVAVVGLSGAGKSSLLRAGLLPAVERGELRVPGSRTWPHMLLTPGEDPLGNLAARLAAPAGLTPGAIRADLAADPARLTDVLRRALRRQAGGRDVPGGRLLLVVDQFEELFTTCADENQRRAFVRALTAAAEETAVVVLGLRADFYAHCLAYPELAGVLKDRQLPVPAMTSAQLRDAIEKPAKAAGLQLEPGLTDLLLRDVRAGGDFGAGTLPLLSYALLLTWRSRQGRTLTLTGYQATGGVWDAITRQAETIYDGLDADGQRAARLMLLRMVSVGEGTEDTRRRVQLSELDSGTGAVRDRFAAARLVTVDGDTAQISHEALLRAWRRLREWIDTDRAGLVIRQRLAESARLWDRDGRDASALHRGNQLQLARDWAADHPEQLDELSRRFLDVSVRADRRRRQVRAVVSGALVVLLVAALVAALLAVQGRNEARAQQRTATARALIDRAESARDTAPQLALMLGIAADRLDSTADSTASLVTGLLDPYAGTLEAHTAPVSAVVFSGDGRRLATSGMDNRIFLWDTADPARPLGEITDTTPSNGFLFGPDGRTLFVGEITGRVSVWDVAAAPVRVGEVPAGAGYITAAALDPGGTVFATGSVDGTVRLWDVADRTRPRLLTTLSGYPDQIGAMAFSPDGGVLAAGGYNPEQPKAAGVVLWDVRNPAAPREAGRLADQDGGTGAMAFSPDGRVLAVGAAATVGLWDVADPARPGRLGDLTGQVSPVRTIRFEGPRRVAAAGYDHSWTAWDITDPAKPGPSRSRLSGGQSNWTNAVTLSPDGEILAAASAENTVLLWRRDADAGIGALDHYLSVQQGAVRAVRFSPDGRLAAVGSGDGTVGLWDVTDRDRPRGIRRLSGHANWVDSVAFAPDSRTVASGGEDGLVILWDVSDPANPRERARVTEAMAPASTVEFDPGGRLLAVGTGNGSVSLYDVADPDRPVRVAVVPAHRALVSAVAFGDQGRVLATGSYDGTGSLWDVSDPAVPRELSKFTAHTGRWYALAFDPAGRTLATASEDTTVILWDVRDPAAPRVLGSPLARHTGRVRSIAFSPDGRMLATGSEDQSTRVWDVTDPTRAVSMVRLSSQQAMIIAVAFSPDGRTLATGDAENRAYLWDTGEVVDIREHAVEQACRRAGRGLNPDEWRQQVPDLPYQQTCP
ncbi:caspase, EACC1-associated type [Amycolatopsis tucumanensis]|uniref:caspase, EACC1-associated type n=1 Tax=Amycolatopsis tucumanensis TaxID=401106 RepID=UPI003D72201C